MKMDEIKTRGDALDYVKEIITSDRNNTHGNPLEQLYRAWEIKQRFGIHTSEDTSDLTYVEKEVLSSIATKISRILTGNPNDPKFLDHWLDIIGYAAIAAEAYVDANKPAQPFVKPGSVVYKDRT